MKKSTTSVLTRLAAEHFSAFRAYPAMTKPDFDMFSRAICGFAHF
jgi:hypothetical protein